MSREGITPLRFPAGLADRENSPAGRRFAVLLAGSRAGGSLMNARCTGLTLGLATLLLAGCGSFWNIAETDGTLEDSMRTYTKLVRWGEIERASLFVDEELRGEFIALAPGLERLHFTDFDLGPVDFGENEAQVTVVYRFYDVNTLVERQIVERQRWIATDTKRRISPDTRSWSVRPDLSSFEAALGAPRREPTG